MDAQRGGSRGEDCAARYLVDHGYDVLARNWRCRHGEIDMIVGAADAVVFVEVKTRTGYGFGGPWSAVPPSKQARIRRLAAAWLAERDGPWRPVRFDVVCVMLEPGLPPSITHLRDAF